MKPAKTHLRARARAAKKSLTVWFSAAVPILLACAEALKEQLPALSGLLGGWTLVAVSVAVSTIVAVLRLRTVEADADDEGAQ
jgi:polyferredoxin